MAPSSYERNGPNHQNINIQLKNNPYSNRIQKRRTSFNNYYNYKISESSTENINKENNLKFEQSKSNNTNEVTLSNTNLFGQNQNSLNTNRTINNNIININENLIVIKEDKNNSNNLVKDEKKDKGDKDDNQYENNLILEIITSWNLPEGYKLTIKNKHGLENSLLKKEGKEKSNVDKNIVYFGFQREEDLNNHPNIDYLLYPKEDFYDSKFIGKHFQIRYDTNEKLYYIKDLGFGFGTFIKLTKDIKLKDNFLINIGETYIVFSLNQNFRESDSENLNENESRTSKNFINIKVFSGDEKCDNYNFDYFSNPTILIGRNAFCDIIIEDKMLSRVHCSVFFVDSENEEERGWYLKDGNLNGKKSTNDTWFYSAEETLIEDNMIFKTNHNLFKCIIQKEK